MIDPRIKYYPVENGDTSLITLSDETKILVDVDITNDSTDENNEERYDLLRDLLDNELNKTDGKPYVDVFILSHPDEDHCRGYEKYFYQGDPKEYSKDDKSNELIIVNELWYTPRVFEEHSSDLCSDAQMFKDEAKRRMDLFKKDPQEADKDGNRIRIIGFADNKELKGLEDRIVTPGNTISEFNGSAKDDFSLFIHAPFKDTIDGDDRNETSTVFQAKFKVDNVEDACLAFWGGDAGWRVWKEILDRSSDKDLNWDLFFAPHHCSWSYFNDNSEEGKKEPQQSSIDILKKKVGKNPKVIVSSKEIKRNDDNPPSYKAKNQYLKEVKENDFLVTSTHSDTTPPEPIEFEIKSTGPQEKTSGASAQSLKNNIINRTIGQPKTYG